MLVNQKNKSKNTVQTKKTLSNNYPTTQQSIPNNTQPWHNPDEPFVLKKKSGRISKCQGCKEGYLNEEYVVCHKEGRRIFNKTLKKEMVVYGNGYYHANFNCIFSRHDYFKNTSLVIPPTLQITTEKVNFLNQKRGFAIKKTK